MSEQLDHDLGRAIKDEVGREMQGFEFSAAMKANVMKQIRAGQSGLVVPFERPTARRKLTVPRPLIWTAVAVAAFAFAFNLGQGSKSPSMTATQEGTELTGLRMADPAGAPAPAPSAALPTAPGDMGITAMKSMSPEQAPTRMIELHGVAARSAAPTLSQSPSMDAPKNLRVASVDQGVVMLTSGGVQRMDATHTLVWQNNPGGITVDSALAVSPSGAIAVSAGNNIYLLSQRGVLERTLQAPASVTALTWSADDRLAAISSASVSLFRTDRVEQRVDLAPGANTAFLPDGSLAVFTDQASPKQLVLYDASGGRTFQVDLPQAGTGLAITDGGQTILAGGIAVDLTGQVRWELQLPTAGVTTVPNSELAVAWGGDTVVAVRPDGREVWRARLEGGIMQRAIISEGGSQVAVVTTSGSQSGSGIFVLDMAGDLLHQDGATSIPVDAALTGDKLFLLYSQGHQEFALR